jgi:hypothetical protein
MNAKTQNEKALDTRDLVEAWARERLLTGGSKPRSIRSDKYRVMRFIHFIEAESLELAYVDEQTIWNYQGSLLEKKHAHHDKSLGKKPSPPSWPPCRASATSWSPGGSGSITWSNR